MSGKSPEKNTTVVILLGIILVLVALMLPYPLYTTVPQMCPAMGRPGAYSEWEQNNWCTPAHREWVWQPPLITQIYSAISETQNIPHGGTGTSLPGSPGESYPGETVINGGFDSQY